MKNINEKLEGFDIITKQKIPFKIGDF